MELKEYISSGILEAYVLGSASEQERKEVECLSSIYPELRKELNALSESFEKLAIANAVAPAPHLRDKIFAGIETLEKEELKSEKKIIPMAGKQKSSRQFNYWLAAACVILFIISSFSILLLTSKNNELNSSQRLAGTLMEEKLKAESESQIIRQQLALLNNPDNRKVIMKGTESHPGLLATILWNSTNSEVYLSVSNLPQPLPGKQYQLWAIVDGKPVDMGIFDVSADSSLFRKMKPAFNAQAFAVTLEKKGGSPQPTLSAMYVIGQI